MKDLRLQPKIVLSVVALSWIARIVYFICGTGTSSLSVLQWSFAQLLPSLIGGPVQKYAWQRWNQTNANKTSLLLDIPTLDLIKAPSSHNILKSLETTYGKYWRDRPLLIKGLWSKSELESKDRHLTLSGLLKNNVTIPYFTNASTPYALIPDDHGLTSDIVSNMTKGHMHKFGTQLIVQNSPKLIKEVTPTDLVTELFGDHFTPSSVEGSGPFNIFPALTTVPVFVGYTGYKDSELCKTQPNPRTDLHCEPIGNVAVQLQGQKQWLLISPEHSFQIQPAASPDGRAYFASYSENFDHVPRYQITLGAGDALWVPTWWWHRVDYVGDIDGLAIGGSVFHFRPYDFVRHNPLFATLVIPALIKEALGYSTQ